MTVLIFNILAISSLTDNGSFLLSNTGLLPLIKIAQKTETQFNELSINKPTYSCLLVKPLFNK